MEIRGLCRRVFIFRTLLMPGIQQKWEIHVKLRICYSFGTCNSFNCCHCQHAYCLSRFKFKGKQILNAAFMGGLFINVNYIVVPIFLMLRDGDNWLKSVIGKSFLLNNLVILAIVYAATALPFTNLSVVRVIFQHWHMIMKKRHILMEQVIVQRCGKLFSQWQNHLLLQ